MELIRKPIHYTQEGKSIYDQFYLDEDYNVPDQKEDVQAYRADSGRLWEALTGLPNPAGAAQ